MLRVLDSPASFSAVAREWDDLSRRSPGSDLFTSHDWLDAWWRAFAAPDETMAIVCVEREGRLAAALPLMASPIHLNANGAGPVAARLFGAAEQPWGRLAGRRRLRSIFNHYSGRSGMLFDPSVPDALPELLAGLRELRARWDVIELDWIPEDSPLFQYLAGGAITGLRVHAVRTNESPVLELEGGRFADWYAGRFSAKTRSRDRAALREAAARPGFRLEVAPIDGDERSSRALVDIAIELEALGWKGEAKSAMKDNLQARRFVQDVSARLARRGALAMVLLHLDDQPVAFVLGFVDRGTFYYYKTSFDPAYEELRPGRIVTTRAVEHAFTLGLSRFDFLGAADDYKLRYTQRVRPHAAVFLYHGGLRSNVHRMIKRSAVPMAKVLLGRGALYPVRVDR